ncbi:sensor histidine kinase [Actinomadura rudentiformis]|uniref:sensor histidine kinase n=1 Tax=Actinomadura rudentiformis TaxID=359158 RepID=UPI001CEF905A|nr:HAMP domain-containing sensor histidine kinase [Actinomadura rudentiformis]
MFHLPRRTIRMRLALLYFGVFLASGAILLIIMIALYQGSSVSAPVDPGGVPTTPGGPGTFEHNRDDSDLSQLLAAAGFALAFMAVVSLVLGWLVPGRFLRILRTITTSARQISATNLHERLNLPGPADELKELGDTFDDLLARLERSFEFERRFVANASHELRTPLATMRASLDVAMAKPGPLHQQTVTLADRIRHELDHVDRLLESFLTLARAQHAPVADESTLALGDVAAAALELRGDVTAELELQVDRETSPEARVRGSETLLSRLVENVVDNAVTHNVPGGWVRVRTAARGSVAELVVENGGPVFAQEDLAGLTQPFRRLAADRTGSDRGSGLGLSIVDAIAEVHGGTLALLALPGGGLRVTVTLPLTQTAIGTGTVAGANA